MSSREEGILTGSLPNGAKRLAELAAVAAAYYVVGRLGLFFAIPPEYATAVWPASGIALAGTLLFGYRVWPGIFLGSLLINMWTSLEAVSPASMPRVIVLTCSIGIGASLQAIFGAYLVRRFGKYPISFVRARDVVKFLLLGGPLSCLVSSTWGVTSLVWGGVIQRTDYLFHWWTWWVGDSIGVIIFTPLVLIWAAKPSVISLRRQITVSAPLCFAFMLIVTFFVQTSAWEQDRIRLAFEGQTDRVVRQLQENLDNYIDILQSVEGLYTSSLNVDRQQFKSFVSRWFSRHPGMRALSWNPRILDSERANYEQAAMNDGITNFRITEHDPQGQLVRAARRAEYFPAYYIESLGGNKRALGFDSASDPTRREALKRARDTGKPTATDPLTLMQDVQRQAGFLVFLPVYRSGLPHDTVDERRLNLQGYVNGAFRIRDIMNTVLKSAGVQNIETRLYDAQGGGKKRLLYDRLQAGDTKGPPVEQVGGRKFAALPRTITLDMAQSPWVLEFTPTKEFFLAQRSWQAWVVLGGGLVFAGLWSAFLLVVTGHSAKHHAMNRELQIEIAERKSAEEALRETEAREAAILASALDCIITMDHEGKIVEFNPAAERTFGYARADAVGKSLSELIIPLSLREKYHRNLANYLSTGKGLVLDKRIETSALRADGTEFPVEIAITRIPLEGPPLFTGYLRDITERKVAEHEVKKLAAIVESSNDAIISKTLEGTITSWNHGAESIYGYSAEEVMGRSISILAPPERCEELRRLLQRLKQEAYISEYETVRLRKDGTRIDVSLTISPTKDVMGTITGVSVIARDITARKRAEAELQRHREAIARRLHDSLAQSLTAMSMHLELAEMLLSRSIHKAREHLKTIERVLTEEQRNLRSFVKELRGPRRPNYIKHSNGLLVLEKLVKKLESQWDVRIELEVKQGVNCIPHPLVEDLVYMIQEGVANAVRHGRASVVKVELVSRSGKLVVCIVDNGCGFPFQGRRDEVALSDSGAGPAMLKSRVAHLGGSLDVRSADTGAYLEITLPLSQGEA